MSDTTALTIIAPTEISTLLAADTADILGKLKAEFEDFMADPDTDASIESGRRKRNVMAKKFGTAKKDFERLGETMTESAKATIKGVRDEMKVIAASCDEMRDAILAPVEAYKAIEIERIAGHEKALADLVEHPGFYGPGTPAEDFVARLNWLHTPPIRDWQEFYARARAVLANEIALTEASLAAAIKREAESAELARLRAEQAERERVEAVRLQAEREAWIAARAAERAKIEAEQKAEDARVEAARVAREAEEAAARALAAEKRRAEEDAECARLAIAAEQDRAKKAEADRVAAVELAKDQARKAEHDRLAAIEAAEGARIVAAAKAEEERRGAEVRAEMERIAAAELAERKQAAAIEAERKRVADEAALAKKQADDRAANVAHRSQRMTAAKDALMAHAGITEDQARDAVKAIVAGGIPHVSMEF
jgi:hypothetical protein